MKSYRLKIWMLALFIAPFFGQNIMAQEGVVVVNQDPEISELLDIKKEVNRRASNFKIQIYNGSHEGAKNAREKFRQFYGWSMSTEYETPNYKIWVGNFETRLEADRALVRVKKKFSNAFVFKPKKDKKEP